ncbi:hypothetical protein A2U01_0081645, partial [Trifolium medium]|nr:hypothetical protein [Trifolium medium]
MFCVLSPDEDLESPGDVLECRRASSGDDVARCR